MVKNIKEPKQTLDPNTLPGNSIEVASKEKSTTSEKPKVKRVTKGQVRRGKKTLGRKIAETFLGDDTASVGEYVIHDILIPALKAMMSEMVGGGVDMLLFGERRRGRNTTRQGGRSFVSYDGYYKNTDSRRDTRREMSRTGRARHEFDELYFENRGEAEVVLDLLTDLIIDYGQATVADLYEAADVTPSFVDHKYGWTDLRGVSVSRVRDGYIINLPRTQALD